MSHGLVLEIPVDARRATVRTVFIPEEGRNILINYQTGEIVRVIKTPGIKRDECGSVLFFKANSEIYVPENCGTLKIMCDGDISNLSECLITLTGAENLKKIAIDPPCGCPVIIVDARNIRLDYFQAEEIGDKQAGLLGYVRKISTNRLCIENNYPVGLESIKFCNYGPSNFNSLPKSVTGIECSGGSVGDLHKGITHLSILSTDPSYQNIGICVNLNSLVVHHDCDDHLSWSVENLPISLEELKIITFNQTDYYCCENIDLTKLVNLRKAELPICMPILPQCTEIVSFLSDELYCFDDPEVIQEFFEKIGYRKILRIKRINVQMFDVLKKFKCCDTLITEHFVPGDMSELLFDVLFDFDEDVSFDSLEAEIAIDCNSRFDVLPRNGLVDEADRTITFGRYNACCSIVGMRMVEGIDGAQEAFIVLGPGQRHCKKSARK